MNQHRAEFTCVADRDGIIRGDSTVPSPGVVYLKNAIVETTTGCSSRTHVAKSTIVGQRIDFDSGPMNLVDCERLIASLGDLRTGFFSLYTMAFEIDGFEVGEEIKVVGILEYDSVADPSLQDFNLIREDAFHLVGFGNSLDELDVYTHRDLGAWKNVCKSLMFRWFALFDVRTEKKGNEIAELLSEKSLVRFPDAELRGRDQFVTWYDERFPLVIQGYHDISNIEVRIESDVLANVSLEAALHAVLANGHEVDVKYSISAEISDFTSLDPKIKKYSASPVP